MLLPRTTQNHLGDTHLGKSVRELLVCVNSGGRSASNVSGTILWVGSRMESEGRERAEHQQFSLSASSVQLQCDPKVTHYY